MPNLQKVLWITLGITVLLWIGVGIYYLKSARLSRAPVVPPPQMAVTPLSQPTEPVIPDQFDEVEFVEGNFVDWEEIEGSPDKYILLTDPGTGQSFPKIRVGFEFSILFGHQEGKDATVFAATKDGEDYEVLGYFKDFTSKEINKLIQKGDFVKIILKKKIVEEDAGDFEDLSMKNLKDENGNLLAHWLFIKRENGKQEVEQELDREIQKQ